MYNANYMDGVPVKIAEKYKPPAPIYKLPQHIASKVNLEDNYYWNCPAFSCDLQLEKQALSKIEQWKRIRQSNKEQRKDRILRREQQRKRDEDRQKNLLYSVSYPSTDDLSSEDEGQVGMDEELKRNDICISEAKESNTHVRAEQGANTFHNILQPTILSTNSTSESSTAQTIKIKPNFDRMSNSFNYKDFEEDTSSPFDNVELKTINDLDVLAQVLHNTQISLADQKQNENGTEVSNDNCTENTKTSERNQNATQNIPKPNNHLPRFNNDFNVLPAALTEFSQHIISSSPTEYNVNLPHSTLMPHMHDGFNNSNGYYDQSNYCIQSTNKTNSVSPQAYGKQHILIDDQMIKSKSVPDIVKELRDEIVKSENRRYRNCSCNMEVNPQHNDVCSTNKSIVQINDGASDIFRQLDSKSEQLVHQISAMGFPFKRVARIVQLLGADDKKVVEHLIPLSELVDLGFEENEISEALIRNENNKNKALDDLIS